MSSPNPPYRSRRLVRSLSLALLLAAPVTGCGDENGDGNADGQDAGGDKPDMRFAGCAKVLAEGSDTEAIQTALIEAETGDTLCFEDGTYSIASELSLTVHDVTLRGNPQDREAVVLDYTGQDQGKDGLNVNSDGFTIEHLSLKNTHGNSIVVKGSDRVTFRNLKVSWDHGSSSDNGAYAVYPLSSSNVLVEDCEVVGARDAGIYVGQSTNIIVRNNEVHGNVAGIEIENSDDALVTGNRVYDNSGGILVFVLPNLEKKSGRGVIVENNVVEDNNHPNFGEPGTTVSFVPPGTGMLVLAADVTEVRDNEFRDNDTTGVLAISYQTFSTICAVSGGENCNSNDDQTDPNLSKLFVHGNSFERNGTKPAELVATLLGDDLENVLWDGRKPDDAQDEDQLCMSQEPATLRVFGTQSGISFDSSEHITDGAAFGCSLASPFASIELAQES
jgi:parallel beta-helix repeat protein